MPHSPYWLDQRFDERERLILDHARDYALKYRNAGIPGSNHILLIAKLAETLDGLQAEANAKEEAKDPFGTEVRTRRDDDVRGSVG